MNHLNKLEEIKKTALIAMFSDDMLLENLVLKGGNAIDLIYHAANRASLDLDFSMPKDIDLLFYSDRIKNNLATVFMERGFHVFDVTIEKRPRVARVTTPDFWGGYCIEFKVVDLKTDIFPQEDIEELRKQSIEMSKDHRRKFNIDISKYEYCEQKVEREIDGLTIYVYSLEMIALEKIRSICQQMPDYKHQSNPTPRAKDFFDIYTVCRHFSLDLLSIENVELLRKIFDAKKVSLSLLRQIENFRGFHEPDFVSVTDTVKPGISLESYDFYFAFVVDLSLKLAQALGVE